jgi:chromosome partitioning protein
MKIIALLNEKGGGGKSTAATNLATALHRSGKRVVLIDADPQGTARDWRAASPEDADLPAVRYITSEKTMASALDPKIADYFVIDAPAKVEKMSAAIVRLAHIVLLVIQPSGADVWASAAAVKLVKSRVEAGGKVDAAFLINRVSRSKLSKLMASGEWNTYGIEQLSSTIANRVAFPQAMTDGVSVFDLNDTSAQNEINNILIELETAKWL